MSNAGAILINQYKYWVLFPWLETDDPNLRYYYDFTQSLAEYQKVFTELHVDWKWQPVTLQNYAQVIRSIAASPDGKIPLVLNLCDGDEVNGTPGISVIDELEKYDLLYTGADSFYYEITTSKIPMKKAFAAAAVATPAWEQLHHEKTQLAGICERIGTPVLLKPAVSGGSMGISVKNVVNNDNELLQRVHELEKGYRGWNLLADGLFAEQFITGREFTSLVVGTSDKPEQCIIYEPVERIFHNSLPEHEQFLSFDRLWEIYESEQPMPGNANFYEYRPVYDPGLAKQIKSISLDAYCAVAGKGYGRLDLRMDKTSGQLYVLEVNAQCGLSDDEDYTSIGAILRVSGKTFTQLIHEVIEEAILRRSSQQSVSL